MITLKGVTTNDGKLVEVKVVTNRDDSGFSYSWTMIANSKKDLLSRIDDNRKRLETTFSVDTVLQLLQKVQALPE